MEVSKDRQVEIAQAIAEIFRIAEQAGLNIAGSEDQSGTIFEIWSEEVEDLVFLVDTVNTTLDGSI